MLPLKQSHSQSHSQSDANRSSPISTRSQMPNKEYKTQKHSQPNANEHVHSSQSNSYVNKSLQSINNSPTPTNNFRENKSIHTNHSQTSMKTYTIFALAVIRRQQFTKHNNTNSNSNSQAPTKTYSIRSHTSTTVYNALNPFTAGLVCTLCQGMFHVFLPYFNL